MDTMADRIKKALEVRELTPSDLISRKVLSKAGVYLLLNGTTTREKVRDETITRLCRALDVRRAWLKDGRGPMEGPDEPEPDWADILAYRQAAALGDGAEPDEYAESHKLKFRAESLSRKRLRAHNLGVVYGKGDSMLPRIHNGDAILFDRSDTEPRDGGIYVITYGNDLLAKKLVNLGGRWFIESLNKDDPKWAKPQLVDEVKHFEIHGRVRWIGSWED